MRKNLYLFDTHALLFWSENTAVSSEFIKFFDREQQKGNVFISSISFWEIALLVKKNRIELTDIKAWMNDLLNNTNLKLIEPNVFDMIDSTSLPDYHKDPFDRLLIVQANQLKAALVSRDAILEKYKVNLFWI